MFFGRFSVQKIRYLIYLLSLTVFLLVVLPHLTQVNNSKSMGSGSIHYDKNTGSRGQEPGEIICHYCHKPGHIKRDCRKLQSKKAHSAHIVSSSEISEKSVTISADEYARLTQHQETKKQPMPSG